jgi:Sulfotransferase family
MTPTPLVFVGGSARSGSTLLERMLAGIPGCCPVGELAFIWERCLKRNDRCGCGVRFHDCEFWAQVGHAGFGGWSKVDADEAISLRTTVDRHRNIDRIAGLRRPGHLNAAMTAYRALTDRLYRAVSEVSGAPVIIDSSKSLGYALLLRDLPSVEMRLIHLIRRSHGVAHSWSRPLRKPAVGDGSSSMSVHPASWAIGLWIADNLLFEAMARRMQLTARVRYEDLIADPRAELLRIVSELELPATDLSLSFLDGSAAKLLPTHALSGNPMRSQQGRITLRADDEWRTAMSGPRRALISMATWPLLKHYGYSMASPAQHS